MDRGGRAVPPALRCCRATRWLLLRHDYQPTATVWYSGALGDRTRQRSFQGPALINRDVPRRVLRPRTAARCSAKSAPPAKGSGGRLTSSLPLDDWEPSSATAPNRRLLRVGGGTRTSATLKDNMISYRKAKSGDWVVVGPVSELHVGTVTVTKRDGATKTETVASLGKPFDVNGVSCCYGYLTKSSEHSGPCHNCWHGVGIYPRTDSNGIAGMVCKRCSRDADYELSFA